MTLRKPNPADQHVGNRVRMRRLMMKMSQTELSRQLQLTWQTVQKYEKGQIRLGASRLQQISRILRVKPAFFFEGMAGPVKRKEVPEPDHVSKFLATRDGVALATAFAQVKNVKLRRRLVRLVVEIMDTI